MPRALSSPLLALLLTAPLVAQTPLADTLDAGLPCVIERSLDAWLPGIIRRTMESAQMTFESPAMRRHWAITALVMVAVSPLDDWATSPAVRNKLLPTDWARFGDIWGDPAAALVILPAVALAEYLRGSDRQTTFRRLKWTAASLAIVGVVTIATKDLVGRARPDGSDHRSFPSGHTSVAFGAAEAVRELYGNLAGLPFYLLAVNTGLSRIHDNKHYPSDVVAGAGLGIGIVRGFGLSAEHRQGLALGLQPVPGGAILQLTFRK